MRNTNKKSHARNKRPQWSVSNLEPRMMLAGDAGAVVCSAGSAGADTASNVAIVASPMVSQTVAADLVFVDSGVDNLDVLLSETPAGAEVVLLSNDQPGLQQINDVLKSHSNVRSVHIVSHGRSGQIQLGGQSVDEAALVANQDLLRSWSSSLHADADILLYGCNTGEGSIGERFVSRLSRLTGADVAASTDITGSAANQADWDLERRVGNIESKVVFSKNVRDQYQGVLHISIFAAGSMGDEQMELQINGDTVATFYHVGGDADSGQFNRFDYDVTGVNVDQIRVVFTNDLYDPNNGVDRNLIVDRIEVDGVSYESESPSTFSTGTWTGSDSIQPGNHQSDTLHANGYFQYASGSTTVALDVYASGSEGGEQFEVLVDGQVVGEFTASTETEKFSVYVDPSVSPSNVRVQFTNDQYDPDNGIDRNLIVDRIVLNGQVTETESGDVFSTGTWTAEDGIQPGFRHSEVLHTNGYFQYGSDGGTGGGLANVEARSEFGVANDIADLQDPSLATPLVRVTTPSYPGDGSGAQWDAPEPSLNPQLPPNSPNNVGTAVQPLKITDNIYAPGSEIDRPNSAGLNEFSQFFAQFLTHDMVQSVRAAGPPIFLDGQFIPVARTPGIVQDGVLQQVSSETPTLDLGLVYGRDAAATDLLREVVTQDGKYVIGAKLIAGGAGDVLPSYFEVAAQRGMTVEEVQAILGTTFLNLPPEALGSQAATGDERANQTTSLTVHHTIWHRNHNWHVEQLASQNSDWSQEQLYQAARALNEADFQHVVYNEYLPKLLGQNALSEYTGFKADVDNSIINEWTTVAFRFGHDQASAGQLTISEDGQVDFVPLPVSSLIGNSGQNIKSDTALGDWTRGQLAQSSQEIDGRVVEVLRNALFGVPANQDGSTGSEEDFLPLNLPLLDIHRGRDHGVSDYNQLREGLGLSTYDSLEHFAAENGLGQDRLDQLYSVYSDISEVDSIVGGLLEAKVPGSQLGETFTILNVMQFEATRDGDEFFYLNRFKDSPEVLEQITSTSMNDILIRNGVVDSGYVDAFQAHVRIEGTAGNDEFWGTNHYDLMLGHEGNDVMYGGEGNDSMFGGIGNDWIFGQGQDDFVHGGHGNDFIFGGWGNDRLVGGSGFDILNGGHGNDVFIFSAGSDTDLVKDFSSGDKIDFSSFGFSSYEELESHMESKWHTVEISIGMDKLIVKGMSWLNDWQVIV